MPTWLTGALVTVRMAKSATDAPRNSHTSPVEATATASSRDISVRSRSVTYAPMKVPWKIVGLAGVAGVTAATGVVVARNRRDHTEYDPDELRDKLHSRVAEPPTESEAASRSSTSPPRRRPRSRHVHTSPHGDTAAEDARREPAG